MFDKRTYFSIIVSIMEMFEVRYFQAVADFESISLAAQTEKGLAFK